MNGNAQRPPVLPANLRACAKPKRRDGSLRPRLLIACLLAALSHNALATCALQSDGVTVICNTNAPNPFTNSINAISSGAGTLSIPTNGAKVIVQAGAGVATTGAAIQVNNNSTVTNAGSISTTFINAYGIWAGDPGNASSTTVGYGNTLENDGSIRTTGSNSVGMFARTANKTAGNTLINRGTIDTSGSISGTSPRSSSAGIRSDSAVASTILNYGTVAAHGAYATVGTGATVAIAGNGVEMAGPGTFINEAGAGVSSDNAYGFYGNGPNANGITVINAGTLSGGRGAILFGAGQSNNTVMLEAGSTTTGSIDGGNGGSNNTLVFDGFTASAFANAIPNWQLVALRNSANVTLSGSSYALTHLALDAGTTATFATPALTIGGQITDNGSLVFASSSNLSITAPIAGSGAVTQSGSGTLLLSGAGTYTGTTTVASGVLQAGGAGVLSPSSAFTVNSGATLDLGNANQTIGSLAGAGTVTLGAGTLTTGGLGSSTTFGGAIGGSGGLTKTGAGTMTLTGTNTYTGSTTLSSGALQLGNGGTSGSIIGNVTNNSSLVFDRSDASIFSGMISGSGNVTQLGSGATILTSNNAYSGGTTISAGTLQLGNGSTTGSIVGDVTDNGTLAFDRSDVVTFPGLISGSGAVAQLGTGTTLFTGNNTYTGGTTISAGTLQLGSGGTTGSVAGDVTNNGALVFDRADVITFPGWITGSGSVTQQGTGTTILAGNNTYDGGTTISAGTLQLGNGGTTGSIVGDVTDNGTLAFDRSDVVTFPGLIAGSGSVTQLGTGTTILTGNNTYTGGTTISAGTLQLGNGGTTGSIVGDVTDNGTLAFDRSDVVTFPGLIAGSGSVTQLGAGTTLFTANNTYTGGTTISAGTLQLGNGGTSGSIVGNVTNNGALVFDRSDVVTFPGLITGSGSVTQQGTGTTIFTGTNTYAGGTTIQAGMLQLGNNGTTGSIVGDVANSGRLVFDRADTVTFAGVISGSGSVKQLGGGTTILTGNNTYGGGTVIAGGALQLGAGGTTGSIVGDVQDGGALIFNRSDTFTFNGVISDWTHTTPDPIGSLQQNGSGTTVLTALNTYSGTTQVNAGTLVIGNVPLSTAALAGGGTVTVASSATFGGYGSTAGAVDNNGTIAVADALPLFQGGSKGDFVMGGTLTNNNLIQLAGSGVGNTLFVHDLVGQGSSRIAMNTVLGGDTSQSDLLVINAGSASGRTVLNIANAGGLGAATTGNGILVVAAAASATTAPGSFALGTSLEAGPYQYALFRGARDNTSADSWYLRSENPTPPLPPAQIPESVPPPPPVVAPGEPTPPPLEPYVPYYRSEVSLYTALPSMALNYGRALIGTLHDRVGEEEQLRGTTGDVAGPSGAWARVVGQDGQWDAKAGGVYRDGPSFDDNMIAVQAGLDLYRAGYDGGARDIAGVLAAVGHGHGGVSNYDGTSAGNNRFDSYSVGGYWTRFGANDGYLDGVLQGTWYDAKATSNEPYSLSTHGFGAALSVEGGYPFRFDNDWSLEPQGQVIYQTLHLDNASDAAARVQFRDGDSLAARIGGRAARTWQWDASRLISGWFFANLWHEFKADTVTAFSSADGNVPFHSDLGGSWWEVGVGVDAQLRKGASLYATVGYDKGFSQGVKAIDGNIGMRFHW
ncbi:autotransporter-associated beta strand repeat-containing protein [Dyella japonica]|uniref:Autotransporter domain-containing protein n=1 Tax=Dyella japonica A8 TaxID=1217721 RepID=A0A075JVH7_9GAMM|nr:autotransporter-associated beta strand repeat-containing protein [Dyella japonica]AIF45934.1 hypothetical protein HY57_00955 [Dyella japonica A8]